MHPGRGSPPHTQPSEASWAPTIHLDPNTICQETESDPQVEAPSPSPSLPHASPSQAVTWVLSDQPQTRRSHDPCLGLMKSLEWLTELRKMVYSLDHQFVIKGLTQEQTEELSGVGSGEGAWGSHGTPPPQGPLSPHLYLLTNPGALRPPSLWDFYGGFVARAMRCRQKCRVYSLSLDHFVNTIAACKYFLDRCWSAYILPIMRTRGTAV